MILSKTNTTLYRASICKSSRNIGDDFSLSLKKRLLLKCEHHFKSDLINDMDHMRISGTEPSSVILSQRKWFKKLKMHQTVEILLV